MGHIHFYTLSNVHIFQAYFKFGNRILRNIEFQCIQTQQHFLLFESQWIRQLTKSDMSSARRSANAFVFSF